MLPVEQLFQYGLGGAVIGVVLFGVYKLFNKVFDGIITGAQQQISDLTKNHSQDMQRVTEDVSRVVSENTKAMTEHSRSMSDHNKAIQSLTKAIHEQNNRRRVTDGEGRFINPNDRD